MEVSIMFRTRVFSLLAALCCICALAIPSQAAEVDCDSVYCFVPEDFGVSLSGICITDLPDSNTGTVFLGSRVLQPGDILTAQQLTEMTFSPLRTEQDTAAEVGYLPIYDDHVAPASAMTIGIRGKEDLPPVAEDSAAETYKNLSVTGKLKVSDPEAQAMTFTVTRQPKRGTVEIAQDGSFTYTPKKNKVGVDSFVYTATDPAGKVSREATVTITILKPSDTAQYTDTIGRDCRFAAEWMRHTGIFVGESLAENPCFSPDREVTRGEFVTMLVKTLDIPTQEDLAVTGYTDETPLWLQPYLAAAIRSGFTEGLNDQETFGASLTITQAEAHRMLENALDQAIFDTSADTPLTRGDAAQLLYQASRLAETVGKQEIV